jgi:multiple sugar transport system permease protein
MAAFALARIEFRFKAAFKGAILAARLLPPVALAVPLFLLVTRLGLADTRMGLALAHSAFNLPFAIWLLTPFFAGIPKELEEAATVDGFTRFQIFRIVYFPLALPGVLVASLFCFLLSWNDFLFSLILAGSATKTAPLAVNGYMTGFGPEWGPMTAASVVVLVPVFVLSLFLQRSLVGGIQSGGIKG